MTRPMEFVLSAACSFTLRLAEAEGCPTMNQRGLRESLEMNVVMEDLVGNLAMMKKLMNWCRAIGPPLFCLQMMELKKLME